MENSQHAPLIQATLDTLLRFLNWIPLGYMYETKLISTLIYKENSQNAPLIEATLETLLRFLNWIPLGYMYETKLISTLIYKVCITTEKRNVPMFWKVSLKCLTEIAGASVSQDEEQHVTLFTLTMMQSKRVMF
ncbi:hypothetical protein ASZ78_004775 [Callipepla squamata]|uniref:Exportin-1/Importin-beta-like domain-containing protein n=1 Tax=Callipepla squamata TaxID=9009 RepID=A0A226MBL0_CALSU|nr:hypothetical protein ASZ78_004775 [Callipepla squamata]